MTEKKTVPVEEAVGEVLLQDITRIAPDEDKGPAFKKGHVIKSEDVSRLKDLGKENIYVFELGEDQYHEEEAGELFKQFAGSNVKTSGPSEGKVVFRSGVNGMVDIDKQAVDMVNKTENIVFTTLHSDQPVGEEEDLAGIRIVPLVMDKAPVDKIVNKIQSPPLSVHPFTSKKVGLIVTGSEVASGRIDDAFKPVITSKVQQYNSTVQEYEVVGDEPERMVVEIERMISAGCDFIILTGGMSVDPDDKTSRAIREAGVEVVSYGAPVLPGNMFMAGYRDDIPVFGVPACAIYYKRTALDLFLPYVFADKKITAEDINKKGYGGYCRHCSTCTFPSCEFGKR
ncbi:MAG: molybdopterin-binding protein [bacterium]